MDDEVQVVYSAEAEGLIAGNAAVVESVQETSDVMTGAVEAMAAATSVAGEEMSESFTAMADSMGGFSDASSAVVESGQAVEAQMSATAVSVEGLVEAFEASMAEFAGLGDAFEQSNGVMEESVAVLDALTGAYLQLQAAEGEQVASLAAVREAYAALDASLAPTEAEFAGITAAEERETAATEQLALAQRQLAETQEFLATSAEAGVAGENALTDATERLTVANHAAVTGQQATSAAIRALEGNAGLRAVENFIAKTLGLGPAMQAIFPLVGAFAFGAILVSTVDKLVDVEQKAAGAAVALNQMFQDNHDKAQLTNDDLAVTNDKLQDQIDKLEGHPNNGLQTALDEGRKAADKLLVSLQADRKELEALLKEHEVGTFGSVLSGVASTSQQGKEMLKDQQSLTDAVRKANSEYLDAASKAGDDGALKAATDKRNEAIKAAFQSQIATYHAETARLQKEQDDAKKVEDAAAGRVSAGAMGGYGGGGATPTHVDNSAKIANTSGREQELRDQLNRELLDESIQGRTEKVGQLKQDKADDKKAPDKSGEAVQGYQEELNKRKMADGEYHEIATSEEIAFWQSKLKLWNDGTNAYREITAKIAELGKQEAGEQKRSAEEGYRAAMAGEELKLRAVQKGSQQAIAIRNEEEVLAIAWYGADSKQALEAAAKRVTAERDAADEIMAQRIRAAVATAHGEEQQADQSANLQLDRQNFLVAAGLETKTAGQEQEAAIIAARDAAVIASAKREIEALEMVALAEGKISKELQDAYNRLAVLEGKQQADEQKNTQQHLLRLANTYNSAFGKINSGFRTAFDGWLRGSESFGQAFTKMFQGLARSVVEGLAEMGLKWAEHEALKLLLTLAGQEAQTLATATGTAERKAITASSALAEANQNAMKAATGAYAATVDIPIVGPVLAPIAAGAAYVAVMGLTALSSASGGWGQIPSDQMAMVHKNEMVLPASIAQNVRDMTGGGSGDNHFHLGGNSYSALGTGAMRKLLQGSQRQLVSTMKGAIRDGKMANP